MIFTTSSSSKTTTAGTACSFLLKQQMQLQLQPFWSSGLLRSVSFLIEFRIQVLISKMSLSAFFSSPSGPRTTSPWLTVLVTLISRIHVQKISMSSPCLDFWVSAESKMLDKCTSVGTISSELLSRTPLSVFNVCAMKREHKRCSRSHTR